MSEDGERLRKLWCEVLIGAIRDAIWPSVRPAGLGGSGQTTELDQRRARRWFGSKDFSIVCALAGFEPEFVRQHVVPLFDAPPERQRAFLSGLGLAGTLAMSDQRAGKSRTAGKLAMAA